MFRVFSKKGAFVFALLASCFWHGLVFFTYPPGSGPDGVLYTYSALGLFEVPPPDLHHLMDRNSYFIFLTRLLWDLTGSASALVLLMHLVLIATTLWCVHLAAKYFDTTHAWCVALALTLLPELAVIAQVTNSEAAVAVTLFPACTAAFAAALQERRDGTWAMRVLVLSIACFALACTARPSSLAAFFIFACFFAWRRIPARKAVVLCVIGILAFVWVPFYNLYALGYFGLESKTGRIFFQTAYTDQTFSPENGPASLRLMEIMQTRWPQLLRDNQVIRQNDERIEDLLRPGEFPWHLYYVIVANLRQELPPQEADLLLKKAGIEAFKRDKKNFIYRRLSNIRHTLAQRVVMQLDFTPSSLLANNENKVYQANRSNRYRGAAVLQGERKLGQSDEQFRRHHENMKEVLRVYNTPLRNDSLLPFFKKAFYKTPRPRLFLLYGVLLLASTILLCVSVRKKEYPLAALTLSTCAYTFGNLVFVFAISSGTRLHLLPGHFMELCVIGLAVGYLALVVGNVFKRISPARPNVDI